MNLREHLARNRAGQAVGLPAWCTAHPETLAAILYTYRNDQAPILIEATCNQVNQFGGYTGMTPSDFVRFVHGLARAQGIDPARVILGGDHLGPNPWKAEPADRAMAKAGDMVAAYVTAGFTKIHLDASMACDGETLAETEMAVRAADLCAVAEGAAQGRALSYVIGTEVPVPGGETTKTHSVAITTPDAARRTYDLHRQAFAGRGLDRAFDRVIGMVVQPGVDFSNDKIIGYDPAKAASLAGLAPALNSPVFEAHSTDYQTRPALSALIRDHFALLKVGPELTFAYRQAVLALERLEALIGLPPSGLTTALLAAMRARPEHWRAYVEPGPHEDAMMLYGLSDRSRYYWPDGAVQAAQTELFTALRRARPAPGLVAQITGGLVSACDPAILPETVIRRMVGNVVTKYRAATGA